MQIELRIKKSLNRLWLGIGLCLMIFLARCVYLDGVEQPSSVKAGETVHALMHAHIDAAENRSNVRLVIGVLVPRSWNGSKNINIQYTSNLGDGDMVEIPKGVKAPNSGNNLDWSPALMAKFGIGPNLIDDMEWIVFWSTKQYNIQNGDKPVIEAQISMKSGQQNMKFKFGYFIGSSEDGLNDFLGGPGALYKRLFSDCFDVFDGEGDVLDFCNPPQTIMDPYRSTDNDILTLTYDRDILPGPLGDDIYLCAKAITADNKELTVYGQTADQQLTAVAGAQGRFEISFWPRQYFNLEEGQTIQKMEYFFTDQGGTIKAGYGNTEEPFVYTFRCD